MLSETSERRGGERRFGLGGPQAAVQVQVSQPG